MYIGIESTNFGTSFVAITLLFPKGKILFFRSDKERINQTDEQITEEGWMNKFGATTKELSLLEDE